MSAVKAFYKMCSVCNHQQPKSTTKCSNCGIKITKSGKKRGRPVGTTAAAGYKVGRAGGRPKGSTLAAGKNVGTSGGRPKGTTLAVGSNVGMSGGRPEGTTLAAGSNVGMSGGCPQGTTLAAGSTVGMSGGRPEGTLVAGCSVGLSGGRPDGTTLAAGYDVGLCGGCPEDTTLDRGYGVGRHTCSNSVVDFNGCNLPSDWDVLSDKANVSDDLRSKLRQRISTQRSFDQQPLTKRICWQCGRVLWGDGSSKGTYIVDPPKGMRATDAPANAFLKAVDNSFLTYEHDGIQRKWYSCAFCKTNQMPAELYVGDVLDTS